MSVEKKEIAVVMPVYNEAKHIVKVVRDWMNAVTCIVPDCRFLVIDDGSTDGADERLREFDNDKRVTVRRQPNSGHGPTILRGYGEAVGIADWVFQVDSDGEIPAAAFPELWRAHGDADLVLGRRTGRLQTPGRKLLSWGARRLLGLACGCGVSDANSPCRLMRSASLAAMLKAIPPDTFAPNIAICGLAARLKLKIVELPVASLQRQTGRSSLAGGKMIRKAPVCAMQTVRILAGYRKCAV